MENYEKQFIVALKKLVWEFLESLNYDIPQENKNEYKLIEFYGYIFKNYLRIEIDSIEEIFRSRFNKKELINYFIDYYKPEKFFIFIAFIIHLTLEENFNLLPMRYKVTGKYYGEWKTAEINVGGEKLSKLIEQRIQYSLVKENFAEFYYTQYISPSDSLIVKLLSQSYFKSEEDVPLIEDKQKEIKDTLLKKLVGTTASITILTSLGKWIGEKLGTLKVKVWLSSKDSFQAMCSIGCVTGSLKFFGFCMEKNKKAPKKDVQYKAVYRDSLPSELKKVYDRIPYFIKLFINFANVSDKKVLEILENENGKERTWIILQKFFWLITQPYCNNQQEKGKIWKDFLTEIDMKEIIEKEIIKFIINIFNNNNFNNNINTEEKFDQKISHENIILVQKLIEILKVHNIEVHPDNKEILMDIEEKIEEIINAE